MNITIYAIAIWITAIFIISLDVVIIVGSRNISSRMFALFSFLTGIWVISQGFLISTNSQIVSNLLIRFQYILGICIAFGFYHFSIIYPYDKKSSKKSILFSAGLILIFSYLYLFTNLLLEGTTYIGGIGKWAWNFGSIRGAFEVFFCSLWTVALYNLYRTYTKSHGTHKTNLKNMFWALFLGIIPPTIVNILLPFIGYYKLNWFGPITSAIWILIIAYSIIRYRQMSVKTVVTEVLALAMTIIFFINIFIDIAPNLYVRIATFLIFIVLAFYLIRVALRESRQKEELADLNQHLADKVAEQTAEIRQAYEIEKKARADLEKLNDSKNQFIMITQHHLRTPVTSINWQLEAIKNGEYGNVTTETKNAVIETQNAAKRLTHIIDDFLDIAAMKAGSNILNFEKKSLKPAIDEILNDLRMDIGRMKLNVSVQNDPASWPEIEIDFGKIRDILLIVVENAVRYNHEGGTIKIDTSRDDKNFYLHIENTGIGITKEESEKIGSTLFYRGIEARQVNSIGMGVGLSVAKAIIRGHHGSFEITSEGKGKGARVTMRLPIRQVHETTL